MHGLINNLWLVLLFLSTTFVHINADINESNTNNLLDVMAKARECPINSVIKDNPDGSFSIPLETTPFWSSQSTGGSIWGVELADITGDGYPEVIVVAEQDFCYLYSNNSGTVETTPSWQSNLWEYYIAPAFADYDHDGDLDMAVASYEFPGGKTRIYGNDNGTLTGDPVWSAFSGGGCVCDWGDVDNDGDLDLAIADMFFYPAVFYNHDDTLEHLPSWRGSDYNLDFGVAWLDVDNDGDLDLAVGAINWQLPCLRIYYNNGGTLENTASWQSTLTAEDHIASGISVWDINQDGWLDVSVATGFVEANNNIIFMNNNGTLENNPSWSSSDVSQSGFGQFGDLNGDGHIDWGVNNGNAGVAYENIGDSLDPTPAWSSTQSGGLGVYLGDIDQDGVSYKEDTIISVASKKLHYLSTVPIQKIIEITINGSPVPLADYCCNLKSGWVSLKNSIPSGDTIVFKYNHSIDLEYMLSEDPSNMAYLYRNSTVGFSAQTTKPSKTEFKIVPNPVLAGDFVLLTYSLQRTSFIEIVLFDCTGKRIETILKQKVAAGIHRMRTSFDYPAGIYFLHINIDGNSTTEKVIMVK